MTKEEEKKINENVIKMITTFQIGLELMDEFSHSKLFRQGVKFHAKGLMKELEPLLNMVYSRFDQEDEETYLNIERGIREFIAKPIEEIFVAGEREQPLINACSAHARETEWAEQEEELNKRMDIIGTNGNEGIHYDL